MDNYGTISDNMGLDFFFQIQITGLESNTNYLNFGISEEIAFTYYDKYICYSNYNGEIVEIIVGVWR